MSFPVCKQKGFGMFSFRNLFYFFNGFETFLIAFYKLQLSNKKRMYHDYSSKPYSFE